MGRQLSTWLRPTLIYIVLAIFLLWTVAPVIWITVMSLQPEINYTVVPPHLQLAQVSFFRYGEMLARPEFADALKNSMIVSLLTMAFCLLFGSLAAYPLARLQLPLKNAFVAFTMVTRMIPAMILIIPLFLLMRDLHLLDTYLALIITYTAFLLPYVIWMLKNFFEQIPYSLEAAARMDGCSRLMALYRVIIPVAAPGVVATAIFAFIGAWNEFLFALILSNRLVMPVTVRISTMISTTYNTDNSEVAAAGMLAVLPVIVLVFILNRYIIRGLVEGIKYY